MVHGSATGPLALAALLARSGPPGQAPLMPPADIVPAIVAAQASWAALAAYWNRLQTGVGDCLDVHNDVGRTGVDIPVDPVLGPLDHQMDVEREPGRLL